VSDARERENVGAATLKTGLFAARENRASMAAQGKITNHHARCCKSLSHGFIAARSLPQRTDGETAEVSPSNSIPDGNYRILGDAEWRIARVRMISIRSAKRIIDEARRLSSWS